MSIGVFIKKKTAKIVTFPVLNKEKRRLLRKKLELKWGCADTGVLNVYFDSVMRKCNGLVAHAPEIETPCAIRVRAIRHGGKRLQLRVQREQFVRKL